MALAMPQAKTPAPLTPSTSVLPRNLATSSVKPTTTRTKTTTKATAGSHASSKPEKKPAKFKQEHSIDISDDESDMNSSSPSASPFDTTQSPSNNSQVTTPPEPSATTPPAGLPDNTGQITRSWDVPPRPKPGRKPAIDVPPTKRKAQNRDSQRKFRLKKVEEVQELRNEARRKEAEIQQREAQWTAERQGLQQEVQQLQQWQRHAEYWQQVANANQAAVTGLEARVRELEKELMVAQAQRESRLPLPSPHPSLGQSTSSWGSDSALRSITGNLQSTITSTARYPADDGMEIDFTTYVKPSARLSQHSHDHKMQDDVPSLAINHPMEGTCGFCDQGGLCLCKEVDQPANTLPPMSTDLETDMTSKRVMEPSTTATGPGTCDACLADPERRRMCQSLANQMRLPPISEIGGPMNGSSGARYSTRSTTSNRDVLRITCAETFDRLNQFPSFKENSSRIMQELRPEPINGTEPSQARDHAPLAIDKESLDAACMLAAMSSEPPIVHAPRE